MSALSTKQHGTTSLRLLQIAALATLAAGLTLATRSPAQPAAQSGTGFDGAGIDRAVIPGDDFFRFANGGWLATTEIPADRASYGTFAQLTELTLERNVELIRESEHKAAGSEARKIGDYFFSFMDEAAIDKRGLTPLVPGLRTIEAIHDRVALAQALGTTLRADVDVLNNTHMHTDNLFGLWVAQDLDDPTRYAPFLLQGGLTMPDRDYYLSTSQKMTAVRNAYQAHIAAVLTLAQLPDPQGAAQRIFALERRMAEVHWSRADSEEVLKGDNHWKAEEFAQRAPGLDWSAFFAAAHLSGQHDFVVWQPSALIGLSALTASEPLDTWKEYLRFHLIERNSEYLPKAFVDEHFAFHEGVISGVPEQRPRWKRAVDETNAALGEAVGKLYVKHYFPAADKARAEQMVRNLLAAFTTRIDRLTWMTPETRQKAKEKVATLRVGIGYPDHWRDYSGLKILRGDAFGNAERAELFDYHYNLAKLGTPVDRSEWVMNPQLVNAVNLPALNALNFPAAILQPPFFDPHRDAVMNYGAIGSVIGHEISHSFDNQGALFDASGRLKDWWTKEDFAHFQAAGERLIAEFDAYHPFPDLAVNGRQTLAENIADLGGLAASYDAWRLTLGGKTPRGSGGFSAQQLFFLSYAQNWREKIREPELRRRIITDGHAPDEYRADTVRNIDEWYGAFAVKSGQKLYLAPAERVRIW